MKQENPSKQAFPKIVIKFLKIKSIGQVASPLTPMIVDPKSCDVVPWKEQHQEPKHGMKMLKLRPREEGS